MKLIDALDAGFFIAFCKNKPVRDIRVDKEQGVVFVEIDGGRTEYFSTQFSVPNDTLELSTVVNFNEEIAAALLMPSGVAPVTRDNISPVAMNVSMRRAADHREEYVHNRMRKRGGSMFNDPNSHISEQALRVLTNGINQVTNNHPAALDEMFKERIEEKDLTKWTKPKSVF